MSLPPQTPLGGRMGGSGVLGGGTNIRPMQTPLKTPSRTPSRTPGGGIGEQMSHTPVINFAAIEAHKENVQPLVQGRSAHALNTALSQRQAELRSQRKKFEILVQSEENADSDDPLDAWIKYVKWCIDSYPSGQSSESELVVVLERCTRLFKSSTQYKNDVRYLRMWILYARNVECPSEVYNFLLANEIGTSLASLYEELALVYEGQQNYEKSDETYRMGIHRSAQPLDRLKRRFTEFQGRILLKEGLQESESTAYKDALRSAMSKAQRSMLGTKSGSTSVSANTVRGLGGDASLPSRGSALSSSNNLKKPSIFKDADGDDVFVQRSKGALAGTTGWSDLGTSDSRKHEKSGMEAIPLVKGGLLPQRERGATPKRPAIAIYRDSDDEEVEEEGRTPAKSKSGELLSKVREPSESDRIRKNPFANYGSDELKPSRSQSEHISKTNRTDAAKVKPEKLSKSTAELSEKSKKKSSSSKSDSKASSSSKEEKYAAPIAILYPGLDIDQAVRRTSRKHKSGEVCMEELVAKRYKLDLGNSPGGGDDPWKYLDAIQGKWLPEIKPPPQKNRTIKRDPTVTAFTRAAQDEVMQMFNGGMADSDEEDESSVDEQSESEEEDEVPNLVSGLVPRDDVVSMKENELELFTPTPNSRSISGTTLQQLRPLGSLPILGESSIRNEETENGGNIRSAIATPGRKVFGGDRKPLLAKMTVSTSDEQIQKPQRISNEVFIEEEEKEEGEDDDDSIQATEDEDIGSQGNEEEELDYLNRPMRELAPLSPITEATEYTRYSTRTSRMSNSIGRISDDNWTREHRVDQNDNNRNDSVYGDESLSPSEVHPFSEISLQNPPEEVYQDSLPESNIATSTPTCPFESEVINSILARLPLCLESSEDFVNLPNENAHQLFALQKRAAQLVNKRRSSSHTSLVNLANDGMPKWTVQIAEHTFIVRQKLGEGGYGAVFLAEDDKGITGRQRVVGGINGDSSFANLDEEFYDDQDEDEPKLIAIKVESPPNRWEFYILGQLRARLIDENRLTSIICARKFFCFQDESFLMLEYAEKGTLLEIVNNAVKAGVASSSAMAVGGSTGGGASGGIAAVGIDEVLVMFFVIEVIKCVEALHAVDLLHGDLKIDNCLLRLNESSDPWTHSYKRTGENGWSSKGITLIDFGKAIDLRQFSEEQQFVANWEPEKQDMPQIHNGDSWRYEIDYYGIASIAYCLLFGKYIEIVQNDSKEDQTFYSIDKPLRRYWQVDIWTSLFNLCLNSAHEEQKAQQLASVRDRMETWLEENCFRAGKNLKGSLKKLEIWSMKRTI